MELAAAAAIGLFRGARALNHPHPPQQDQRLLTAMPGEEGVAGGPGFDKSSAFGESRPRYWNRRRLWLLAVPLLLVPILGFAVTPVDSQIVTSLRDDVLPGDLRKLIQLTEAFAHGAGVFFIFGILLTVDVRRRRQLTIALAMVLTAMAASNVAKSAVLRIRPHAAADFPELTTSWWPETDYGFWDSRVRSFPSGHSATAVAMAFALGGVYTRGRHWFAVLAVAACLQRIIAAAHYPSDVLGGLAIATLIAILWPWDYISREPHTP